MYEVMCKARKWQDAMLKQVERLSCHFDALIKIRMSVGSGVSLLTGIVQ